MNIKERHAERDRRDAEQVEREEEALSKLYRMEFYMSPCDSCGGHRQSRYVEVDMESVAEAEHDQWRRWVQTIIETEPGLSPERIARWREYMVPYEVLAAEVKEYDRVEARRWIVAALGGENA